MPRNRIALLVALGADNVGSGLFLPLALLYTTRVVGLPLSTAGLAVSLGTVAGLLVPALAGRLVDRIGPRPVVITAQLTQAAGAGTYLAAHGVALVVLAAILLAAGQQLFYSALFALIADVAGAGAKDKPFAVVAMVRSACFGFGGLVVGSLLTVAGPVAYRIAVGADAVSFLLCALLLAAFVRLPRPPPPDRTAARPGGLLRNRPYLALIGVTGLLAMTGDFFLVGMPVYALDRLHGPPWLPGAILALFTLLISSGGTLVLRLTRNRSRTTATAFTAGVSAVWCVIGFAASLVPRGWVPPYLLASTVILAAAVLTSRVNALAEAAAPPAARGRYLAGFQYAFTSAGVIAPGVVGLFAIGTWVPWLLVGACAVLAAGTMRRLGALLPAHAVHPRLAEQDAADGGNPGPARQVRAPDHDSRR